MPLSDEDDDDDYARLSAETEGPTKDHHSRQNSGEGGHLYADHYSVAGMFVIMC